MGDRLVFGSGSADGSGLGGTSGVPTVSDGTSAFAGLACFLLFLLDVSSEST